MTKAEDKDIVIFLDIDGVIADFEGHAYAENKMNDEGTPKWEKELDQKWWADIPAYPDAKKFYDDLKEKAPVRFLTAPVPSEDCFSGKAKWVQNFLPKQGRFALLDLIICRAKDKHLLAKDTSILIDDRMKNIEEWQAAGGKAIHHKGDFSETLKAVNDILAPADFNQASKKVNRHENRKPRKTPWFVKPDN